MIVKNEDGLELVMGTLELLVVTLAPTIAILLYTVSTLVTITSRLTALETNTNLLLKWVACLNGEMSDKKEFKDFLEKLKQVNRDKFGDDCGK